MVAKLTAEVHVEARKMPFFFMWLGLYVLRLPISWFFKIQVK